MELSLEPSLELSLALELAKTKRGGVVMEDIVNIEADDAVATNLAGRKHCSYY